MSGPDTGALDMPRGTQHGRGLRNRYTASQVVILLGVYWRIHGDYSTLGHVRRRCLGRHRGATDSGCRRHRADDPGGGFLSEKYVLRLLGLPAYWKGADGNEHPPR